MFPSLVTRAGAKLATASTTSVAIFSQSTLRSRHFVATCLSAMFAGVQSGENRALYKYYMAMGDPAAALLWAVLRYR